SFTPAIAHTLEGEVDVWTEVSSAELVGAAAIDPETYEVTLDVPSDVTVSQFTLSVRAKEAGYDNATIVADTVTVLLAGDQPAIAPIDDLSLAPGGTLSFTADITDDGPRGLAVSVATSHVDFQAAIDPTTHEVSLVAPAAATGVFFVTISTVESGFTDRAATTETFYVFVHADTDPAPLGRLPTSKESEVEGVAHLDERAYVTCGAAGLEIFDVSDPAAPVLLGSYGSRDQSLDARVIQATLDGQDATIAFVADLYGGVLVLDVTDPAAITSVATLEVTEAAVRLAVDGNLLYVAHWTTGLSIFDISDLGDIRLLSTVKELTAEFDVGYAVSVAAAGDYAYLVDATGGSIVLDVSDPTDVEYVTTFSTRALAWDIVIQGDLLYVLAQENGLFAVDIQDPTQPEELSNSPMTLMQWTFLDVSGDLAVASTEQGYVLLNVSDPTDMPIVYTFTAPVRGTRAKFFGTTLALPLGQHGVALLNVSDLLAG
ncbi:MAG: LVIVD repeat-containing protein, partial [Planctomycetota bacterium]